VARVLQLTNISKSLNKYFAPKILFFVLGDVKENIVFIIILVIFQIYINKAIRLRACACD
jgi:hypothetical protein